MVKQRGSCPVLTSDPHVNTHALIHTVTDNTPGHMGPISEGNIKRRNVELSPAMTGKAYSHSGAGIGENTEEERGPSVELVG